ncbi:MAG: cysteine-rich CWC family protein [Burkholderiales bacterium]
MPVQSQADNSRCQRCGTRFHCGMNDDKPCWCASEFPPVVSGEAGSSCLCPQCLRRLVSERQAT